MKLVADVEKIKSNLTTLSSEVDNFNSAVSSYNSASINCPVQEISGVLDSYKSSIGSDLDKLNTSSSEYKTLVDECCSEYKANEEKTQTISAEKINNIISNNKEITSEYKGKASEKLTTITAPDYNSKIKELEEAEKGTIDKDVSKEFTNSGNVTEIAQKVADTAINNSGGGYDGSCERWAEITWENATNIPRENQEGAYQAWEQFGVSNSRDNIPVGAMVYGSGSGEDGANWGHVGIYIGDGMVADQGGVTDIDSWLSWQNANCHGHTGWIGWGWQNGIDLTKET